MIMFKMVINVQCIIKYFQQKKSMKVIVKKYIKLSVNIVE